MNAWPYAKELLIDNGRKVPLTMRALIARINRKLAKQDKCLKTARGAALRSNFGDYYVLNWRRNVVTQQHIDPVTLARELGVLQGWEELREEAAAHGDELAL